MRSYRSTVLVWFLAYAAPLLLFAQDNPPSAPAGGQWLDAPARNWNQPPLAIPTGTADAQTITINRCTGEIREPHTPEDRQVTAAGWVLVAAPKRSGRTVVVHGMLNVDGMCRPLQYQEFVFTGGKFAGTLSPYPMDSRSDGALNLVKLVSPDRMVVQYSRYKESDPLCCPSRLSTVEFNLQRIESTPVIVPGAPQTVATSTGG